MKRNHMNREQTNERPGAGDNVRVREFDTADVRHLAAERGLDYADLDRTEKHRLVSTAAEQGSVEPVAEHTSHNVTTRPGHEYRVSNLNPDEDVNQNAQYLAVGDVDTEPDVTNTELNNEQARVIVTDPQNQGRELFLSTFLDSTDANGVDIIEVGMVSQDEAGAGDEDDYLFNHALLAETIEKDEQTTATVDVTLSFKDESEV